MADSQRLVLAETFRHLLLDEPKPVNLAKAAGERLGKSEQAVTNVLTKIRRRINEQRWGPELKNAHQLGDYLVNLTRTIMWTDLPDQDQ